MNESHDLDTTNRGFLNDSMNREAPFSKPFSILTNNQGTPGWNSRSQTPSKCPNPIPGQKTRQTGATKTVSYDD